jgi:hypothetical protein
LLPKLSGCAREVDRLSERLLTARAGALVLLLAAAPASAGAAAAAHPRARAAVIGGESAEPGRFPWMALVLDRHGDEVEECSGTVVAPNLVLTAGHCAENMQTGVLDEAAGYEVVTGNVNWNAPSSEKQVSGVTRVIGCSCFDRGTDVGDVALLELSTPTTAPPVTLAAAPRPGTRAILAGWGRMHFQQRGPAEQLQWAPTVVQPSQLCEQDAPPFSPASQTCVAQTPGHLTGACEGDSGGALLVPSASAVGGMVQIGVVDHGYDECSTSIPSVFARADVIAAWVRGWAQALAGGSLASTVPAPTLPGIASSHSLAMTRNGVSLVLDCDKEGGLCEGDVAATITVREALVLRRGSTRRILAERTRTVRLTSVGFAIAPGFSTSVQAGLSAQARVLLARFGDQRVAVKLAGRGFSARIVALEPAQGRL